MEEEKKEDGYAVHMTLMMGIMIMNPTRTMTSGSVYSSSNHTIPYRKKSYESGYVRFGFSRDIGTDIAIASLLYF